VEFFAMQGNSGDSTEVAGPAAGTSLRTFFRTYEYLFQSQEKLMANPFVHIELNTTDINQAKAFYGKLFDWKLEDVPMGEGSYTMINVGEGTGGGMTKQMTPGAPSAWLSYVNVDDIEAATKKAKSLGAKVVQDVTEVMEAGWLSIIVDPTGAPLGLWKAKTR
jgi:predicted enzyme related to lactoylglutathione lyase